MTITHICGWCGAHIGGSPPLLGVEQRVSHGICAGCARIIEKSMDETFRTLEVGAAVVTDHHVKAARSTPLHSLLRPAPSAVPDLGRPVEV